MVVTKPVFKSSLFFSVGCEETEGKKIMSGAYSVYGHMGFHSMCVTVEEIHLCLLIQSLSSYSCYLRGNNK